MTVSQWRVTKELSALIKFAEPETCRGTSIRHVLTGFGQILADSAGSEETFGLSEQVDRIHEFISHNWSTGRWEKTLVLMLHYNLNTAIGAAFLTSIALLITSMFFEIFGLPRWGDHNISHYSCRWLGNIAFYAFLFAGHHLPVSPKHIFLDKTCICQTDDDLKQKGIASLSAFLMHSDNMLVVYSDTYFKKLWTVYEFAVFLSLHEHGRVTIIHTAVPKLLLACMAFSTIFSSLPLRSSYAGLFPYAIIICFWWVGFRIWSRECVKMHDAVKSSRVKDAKCFVEADRAFVNNNIALFMKAMYHVSRDASEDEALEAFDSLMHDKGPQMILDSFGRNHLRYWWTIAMALSLSLGMIDELVIGRKPPFLGVERQSEGLEVIPLYASFLFVTGFCISPLQAAIAATVSTWKLHWHGWREAGFILTSAIISAAVMFGAILAMSRPRNIIGAAMLQGFSKQVHVVSLVLYVLLTLTFGLLTWWAFRPPKGPNESESHSKSPHAAWQEEPEAVGNENLKSAAVVPIQK